MTLQQRQVREVIRNDGLDIKSASAGAGAIVYEQFGSLHLYGVASGRVGSRPSSSPVTCRASTAPRYVKVGERIESAGLSPTGKRAVFGARGEVLTVPAEKGDARNLTRSSGAADRDPAGRPMASGSPACRTPTGSPSI